ncbi:MAG: class I SAM-dependent methyltransferase [Bacteroidia bacterium]|nr:class I SAM-dependent methyltransferase [Bacteroidia bacterium]
MLPFELPTPAGYSITPKWDGLNFVFGDQCTPVLEFSENFEGWSDSLTALHEEVAGDSHPIDLASRNNALAQVRKIMPSAQTVIMEIGCSSGLLIRDLARFFPLAVILGVDVVKEPLYRLASSFPGIPLLRFDLLQCPLPNQIVDVIVMLNVLEHIEDDVRALQKAYDLLKPDGYLIIEVPAGPYFYDAYDAELHHFRRYSVSELHGKLTQVGFNVCKESHLGFILFPAFAAVKFMNKWSPFRKNKAIVREQVGSTVSNGLVKLAMKFESKHLSNFQLPFGVRALITVRKPA